METIVKTCVNCSKPDDYIFCVNKFLDEDNQQLLSELEKRVLTYLSETYESTGLFPSEDLLTQTFPEYSIPISRGKVLSINDLYIHVSELIAKRTKQVLSAEMAKLSSRVIDEGFTDDIKDKVDSLYRMGKDAPEVDQSVPNLDSFLKRYSEKKSQPIGLVTGVKPVDEVFGGLSKGTVSVLMAFVGSFKTTLAFNIAYRNAYKLGYNIAYISLEVPRDDLIYNLISRHSFETQFPKYPFIGHEKIRKCLLSPDEEDYAFNTVYKDFLENSKGKLFILDETDFKTFSKAEIRSVLERCDDQCEGGLDAVIFDHANLFKFGESNSRSMSQGDIINFYVSFIRQLSIRFRRDKETGEWRQLASLILAQANREGWKRAAKNGGRYDLRAISEANELERCAYRIMAVYTDDNLKESKEAKIQVLKNRSGPTLTEPVSFFVDPVPYVAGDELRGFNESVSTNDLDAIFDSMDSEGGLF